MSEEEKSGEKSDRSDGGSCDFSTKSHLYVFFAKYFYSIVDCGKKIHTLFRKPSGAKLILNACAPFAATCRILSKTITASRIPISVDPQRDVALRM